MRTFFLVLMVLVVAAIIAVATGLVSVNQTQDATLPQVTAQDGTIQTHGGTVPEFEVETGTVAVGTQEANVTVPKVTIEKENATVQVPSIEVRNGAQEAPADTAAVR